MTTYNGAQYLVEQLESLAAQTLTPYELVVADDGSTDGTINILEQFMDKAPFPVTIYHNAERMGYVRNFLHVLDLCSGDAIAYCDQDDVWMAHKLATVSEEFKRPEVMLVIHSGKPVASDLSPLPGTFPIIPSAKKVAKGGRSDRVLKSFPLGFALVFRQEVAQGVTQALKHYEQKHQFFFGHEMPVVWMARSLGQTVLLPEPLVLYRRHSHNITSGEGLQAKTALDALRNGSEQYEAYGAHALAQSELMESMSKTAPRQAMPFFIQEAARSRQLSQAMADRAMLYRLSSRVDRMGKMAAMLFYGQYRSRTEGGLGAKGLAKDLKHWLKP